MLNIVNPRHTIIVHHAQTQVERVSVVCSSDRGNITLSPYQYLIQQRIERAKQLLVQDKLSVAEVAQAVGFG